MPPLQKKDENHLDNGSSPLSICTDDLVVAVRNHVQFLQRLHARSITLTRPSQESLDRYVNGWLPFVATHQDNQVGDFLIPPPDISWLWHCHRLAPARYEDHVMIRFGKLVETPETAFQVQFEDDVVPNDSPAMQTRLLWQEKYPNRQFFLSSSTDMPNASDTLMESDNDPQRIELDVFLKEFELLESTDRQATFLWQVSDPRFTDLRFLQQGVAHYVLFLQLFAERSRSRDKLTPLIPTYQIDLIWHTHMLKSLQSYNQDCIAITGRRFHHDDSLNDRTIGGTLDVSFQNTRELWERTYGIDYVVKGGMYRGEPPADFFDPHWEAKTSRECNNNAELDQVVGMLLAGSFSAGKAAEQAPRVWLKAGTDTYYEGDVTFIEARPKSRVRGVNSNPSKEKYLFGLPSLQARNNLGAGYYHMYTKEGWSLLVTRLQKRTTRAQQDYEGYLLSQCRCSASRLSRRQLETYETLEHVYKELQDLLCYCQAQFLAAGPGAALTPDLISQYKLNERDKPKGFMEVSGGGGGTAFVFADGCFDAAGCGGGVGGGGSWYVFGTTFLGFSFLDA